MRVIAIDPGYDRVGWAILSVKKRAITYISAGCIQTDKKQTLFQRYQQIVAELAPILSTHQPEDLAIETLFFAKNTSTALHVSEARGIIIATALAAGCQVYEYAPNQVKLSVTGTARADKQAVAKMVIHQINEKLPPKLLDDAIDAIAIGITHALHTSANFPLS